MANRKRLFLSGSERAEFEHIYGPLVTDQQDPRFVLVTDEQEALIADLPPGVPVRQSQSSVDKKVIAEHFKYAAGGDRPKGVEDLKSKDGAVNNKSVKQADVQASDKPK